MSTFVERYRKTLAFKSLDVEPLIDRYFHRRIAAAIAALMIGHSITPNQVTVVGIGIGVVGSWMLYLSFFGTAAGDPILWLAAAAFYFFAVIFDCVDGQLARATGQTSRTGRILDGAGDILVLLPAYVILGFGILDLFGLFWFALSAVAGFSTWIHCIVFDKVKNLYVAQTVPDAGEGQGSESVEEVRAEFEEARRRGLVLERALLWLYMGYLHVQDRFAPGTTHNRARHRDRAEIEKFRRQHRPTVFLASFLDLGTHMFLLYASIALMAVQLEFVLVVQVLFATIFNILMATVLWRARRFATNPTTKSLE